MPRSIALAVGNPNNFISAEQTPSVTLEAKDTPPLLLSDLSDEGQVEREGRENPCREAL